MAESYCERICRIQIFRIQLDLQGLFHHHRHLFLGRKSIATDCNLGAARSILVDRQPSLDCCNYSCTLSPSELEYNLGILAHERRLDSKVCRTVYSYKLLHPGVDVGKLLIRILDLAQIKDTHRNIMGALVINTDNPEAKNIGSGVDSEYDAFLSQLRRSLCMDGEPQG